MIEFIIFLRRMNNYSLKIQKGIYKQLNMLFFYKGKTLFIVFILFFIIHGLAFSQPVQPNAHDTTVQLNSGCLSADMFVRASGSTGWYRWYDEALGGNLLDSTTTGQYIMTGISGDTSIYVSAWEYDSPSSSLVDSVFSGKQINLCVEGYMDIRQTITIEAWFNTSGTIGSGDRYDILEDKNWGHNIWLTDQGKIAYYVHTLPDDAMHFISSVETGLNDGTWHHFACVFDHDSMFIYIDGALSAEDGNWGANRYANLNDNNWWLFGKNGDDYRGKIDEIRFWTTARTQQEIQDNMNKCVPADIDGLMWYFQFNEEFGARTKMGNMDVTGNSNEQCGNDTLYSSAHKVVSSNLNLSCTVSESSRDTLDISVTEASKTLYTRSYSLCDTGDVTLTALGGSGQYRWYDQAVGGALIDSTPTLLVENVTADTSLYVSTWDWENPSQSTAQRILLGVDDGTAESMDLGNCDSYYDNSSELTMEVWVKTIAIDRRAIMHNQNSDYNIELNAHGASSGCVGWSMQTDVSDTLLHGNIPVNDDQWHHVACVFNNGQASIYIDGVLDTTATMTGTMIDISTSARNIVGGTSATGAYRWDGYFDEFRLWTTARTQEEIQNYMYKCLYATEDNLIIYVDFNNNMTNLTGVCPLHDQYETYVDEGPFLSCGLCESSRDTVNVFMLDTTNITTDALDSSSFCPGDTITVPFSVCPTTSICNSLGVEGIEFDNENDHYVSLGSSLSSSINASGPYTIEGWIKTDPADNNDVIVGCNQSDGNDNSFIMRIVNNRLSVWTNGGDRTNGSGININDGDWHHVAFTVDVSANGTLYVDGSLDHSGFTVDNIASTDIWALGAEYDNGPVASEELAGILSGIRIWNTERTQTEIQNNKDSCISSSTPGLLALYTMVDTGNSVLTDQTGNGHDGALEGLDTIAAWVSGNPSVSCVPVDYNFIVELSDASGNFSSPTTLQDTLIGRSLVCDDYLSEITTILPDPLTLASGYKVRVVGIADTGSTMTGSISPTTITIESCESCPEITATLSAVSGFDTVCEGSNTQLQINFTSGNNPFDLIYSDLTTNDTITGITQDTAFYPLMYPVWTAGVSDTVIYSIISITDSVNCEGVNLDSVLIEVFKKPITGNPYYIENEYNQ